MSGREIIDRLLGKGVTPSQTPYFYRNGLLQGRNISGGWRNEGHRWRVTFDQKPLAEATGMTRATS
jgi:hypothetical protein